MKGKVGGFSIFLWMWNHFHTMKRSGIVILSSFFLCTCVTERNELIDRYALVHRHHVHITRIDSLNALTLGNGDFAFTADITGLQTFPEYHLRGIPLGTFSNWCWHSYPNNEGYTLQQVVKYFKVDGREIPYYHDYSSEGDSERGRASAYFRQNPHRMNMGMIGLKILKEDGTEAGLSDIEEPEQELNLWEGRLTSSFSVQGVPVNVETVCHPSDNRIAATVTSDLLRSGRLFIELRFPEADAGWKNLSLWGNDAHHESTLSEEEPGHVLIRRVQDSTRYHVSLNFTSGQVRSTGPHRFLLTPGEAATSISFSSEFEISREEIGPPEKFDQIREMASTHWQEFWRTGGAVDFSNCTDERAFELERRVVLSQYLTRSQCGGSLPPQETGLTCNSWFGKFHLEMHWWHGVHFALWDRGNLLARQMNYYADIRGEAAALARMQGYRGVRWPKMVGPDGITSPSTIGNYLIWQQPHYIYLAELLYQTMNKKDSLLIQYNDLVFETADFMASYPSYDSVGKRYVLGPALIPAQETFRAETTINPSFELCYWYWALQTAIEWKERLSLPVPDRWKKVLAGLSDLAIQDSVYLFTEDGIDSYSNPDYLSDHPMVLGCLGMLPGTVKIDRSIMLNTFNKVIERWNWNRTWGWDYPMVAMAAAELGLPEKAVHFLLLDVQKNTYLPSGHNYQDQRLPLYLPGNGGLLTAVASMCVKDQFPKDGNWEVKWENLNDF